MDSRPSTNRKCAWGFPRLSVDGGHPEGFAVRGEVCEDGRAHGALLVHRGVAGQGDNEPVSETDAVGVGVSLAALVDGFAGGGFQVIG